MNGICFYGQIMFAYGYAYSEWRTVFLELRSRKTVSYEEQIYNAQGQISEHIFAPNRGYCVYYHSNLFRSARSLI